MRKLTPGPDTDLSVNELAHALGFHRCTIYEWLRNGTLKGYRVGAGQRLRFPRSELERLRGGAYLSNQGGAS